MAAGAPAPARTSGSSAASSPARRRAASTGGAPRATTISMCASRNGRPRTPSGSGPTARRRWRSPRSSRARASSTARWSSRFALAEVLVEAGERVGLPGLMRPTGSRAVIDRMADAIIHDPTERASLPAGFAPASLSEIVVLSDLWSPIEEIRATLTQLSSQRRAGPSGADRRSGGRDLPLFRPHRVHRAGRRRRDHRRPRRELARRLRGAARAPPRRNPRRDRPSSAGASPSTAPTGRRTNCCWRCTPASAKATTPPPRNRRPHGMALGRSA